MAKLKNRIKKLTEEDYQNYIMALKDENPPLLVREAHKDN